MVWFMFAGIVEAVVFWLEIKEKDGSFSEGQI